MPRAAAGVRPRQRERGAEGGGGRAAGGGRARAGPRPSAPPPHIKKRI